MNCFCIEGPVFRQSFFRFSPRFVSVQRLKPISKARPVEKWRNTTENVTAVPRCGSDLTQSEIDAVIRNSGHREDWQVIYHLRAMPFVQAFSKMKLLLTFSLVAGTPISLALHFAGLASSDLCWFIFGASLFSLATLSIFSYYSTRVIGVISQHKSTGLLRIGLLNFWGSRHNIIVFPEQFLPATDLSGRSLKRTVRVGIKLLLLLMMVMMVTPATPTTMMPMIIIALLKQDCYLLDNGVSGNILILLAYFSIYFCLSQGA